MSPKRVELDVRATAKDCVSPIAPEFAKAEYFDIVHQYIASAIDFLLLQQKIIEGPEFAFPWGLVVFWLECLLMRSGMLSGQDCIKLVFPPKNPSVQGCHGLASAEDDQPGTNELRWLHEQ
ncbi:hypothetical protein I7I51_08086 [Histoplasma capsulatum]|uniref:Uncharacterized protein n=1 Tax=Ajellomyces capsulatus TaxID=5037 RepID=A0A8A1M3A7_AJECA|nr:hypothetical protein I7I51_08086 [Histoplasma capsulatum]